MSKGIYIGNSNKAHKSKKLYIGINNVAHKIKRAYIGDENNKSRLIYISGYSYQKFVAYVWKKYKLNTSKSIEDDEWKSYSPPFGSYEITAYQNVKLDSYGDITGDGNSITVTYDEYVGKYSSSGGQWEKYPYLDLRDLAACGYFMRITEYYNIGDHVNGYPQVVETTNSRGSYIGEVTATSRDEYPDNNYSGSYWYVYDREEYTTVTSEYKLNEGAQTTLSGMSSQRPSGYPSVWVDENGNITGNGTAYTNTWRSYYSTYKSSYPYIYYNSKWYRIVSVTSTSATVVPLTTS